MSIFKKILNFFTDGLVIFFIVVVVLATTGGVLGYKWWNSRQENQQLEEVRQEIEDTKNKKPKEEEVSKHDSAHGQILSNHQHAKKLAEKIAENPKELGKWEPDLKKIRSELLTVDDLRLAGRENPEEVEKIYIKSYQQGLALGVLNNQIIPVKEVRDQWKAQEKWLADEQARQEEQAEAYLKIKELMDHFYDRFMNEKFTPEERGNWNVEPLIIKGQPADPANLQDDVNYIFSLNISDETIKIQRVPIEWKGFRGFFGSEEDLSKKEGKYTMGYTSSDKNKYWLELKFKDNQFHYCPARDPFIKLKKELLFNRQNRYYDTWITWFKDRGKKRVSYRSLSISEESLINTISHELAHAVINSLRLDYAPEEGGHGTLHDEYTDQIEAMIKADTARYESFMNWWREPQTKNG